MEAKNGHEMVKDEEESKFYREQEEKPHGRLKFTIWAKVRCGVNKKDETLAKIENFPIYISSLSKLVMDDEYLLSLGIQYSLSIGNNVLELACEQQQEAKGEVDIIGQDKFSSELQTNANERSSAVGKARSDRYVRRAVLRIKDDGSETILNNEAVDRALSFMDEAISFKRSILVHCEKGISRSTTIICAHLITRRSFTFEEALELVRRTRPQACPNLRFAFELRKLEMIEDRQEQ
jgi:predicted protein tyrosine phosphatase